MRRARRLRQEPTPAEIALWQLIYPFRTGGHHFRKQAPIGPYVVDFVCHAEKLVIEVDGDSHYTDAGLSRDAVRTAFLATSGYRVLRFTNLDVLQNREGVFDVVAAALRPNITPS
jgi:very-short-patch-repair endonuclease